VPIDYVKSIPEVKTPFVMIIMVLFWNSYDISDYYIIIILIRF
jgi:hypothetical protein